MSDGYDYGDYQNDDYGNNEYEDDYANQQIQIEEDYQTKVQLQFFEAQQLLRKNHIQQCIQSLQKIYQIAQQQNLKNWKVKILSLLLQINCRSNNRMQIKNIIMRISELNKTQKYTQNAIKSIIVIIKSLGREQFEQNKQFLHQFIQQLDKVGKIKSYLLLLLKAIQQQQMKQTQYLFNKIYPITLTTKVPSSTLIQFYSYQILYSKKTHKNMSNKIKKIKLQLEVLEEQCYMSQGHLSVIKQAIAQDSYLQADYQQCSMFLLQAFLQNIKYGKSIESKKILIKTNVLMSLLTNNPQIYRNQKYSALFHQKASSFKGQNDIQSLYGLVQAFSQNDIVKFRNQINFINLKLQHPYEQILSQVIDIIKMNKIEQIIKNYSKIKLQYLSLRLDSSKEQIKKLVFYLIMNNKIDGRLRTSQNGDEYLDINMDKNQILQVQLKNIKQLQKRYF